MNRNEVVIKFLEIRDQLHILHWQTKSYARHKAFNEAYDGVLDLADEFVEGMSGKYGNFKVEGKIEVKNLSELELNEWLTSVIQFLKSFDSIFKDDTDLLNIRDEMLGLFHKLKYLSRLE